MVSSISDSSLEEIMSKYSALDSPISHQNVYEWEDRLKHPHDIRRIYFKIITDQLQGRSGKQLEDGVLDYVIAKHEKTAELAELESHRDHLTGLYNRRAYEWGIERILKRSERKKYEKNGEAVALIFMDIDNFKNEMNDKHGHDFGDDVLKYVSKALQIHTRGTDLQVRYGGDEVFVVLDGFDPNKSEEILRNLKRRVEDYVTNQITKNHPDKEVKFTLSMGMSVYKKDAFSSEELLENADKAMYEAKRAGKNQFKVYSPK